ncbi:kinetochore-associated protein 1-like [Tubulanus polymorphus]|uniref:kinetochore-associated protein 1-like n=1 Tax=Tubulanus polymorphus TaxID=672921 RepID=UPI003DA6226B
MKMSKMVWDKIVMNFGNDETVNFGPRQETGSYLYQVDTLVTISTDEKVQSNPTVYGHACGDVTAVAVGSQVSVFSDICHKFLLTLNFDSAVDVVCFTDDMIFLVIAESNGCIHIMDVALQKVFMSKQLLMTEDLVGKTAFNAIYFNPIDKEEGACDLLILANTGKLFQMSRIQTGTIHDALQVQDFEKLNSLQQTMTVSVMDASRYQSDKCCCVTRSDFGIVTGGFGNDPLTFWSSSHHKAISSVYNSNSQDGVKKCLFSHDGLHMFILDQEGYLSVWDPFLMCYVEQWRSVKYRDILFLEEAQDIRSFRDLKIVGLTDAIDDECILEVRELENFELIYSLHLSAFTTLVSCPSDQESVLVVEGVYDENENVVAELRIRSITEAQPETRLYRLLHKEKFDEAIEFAKLFELDVELVYKTKASYLLNVLSPWNTISDEKANECSVKLRECLEIIQDEASIVDHCVNAALPSFEATMDLLMYAKSRVQDSKDIDPYEREKLMVRLFEALNRLWTFHLAFGAQAFTGQVWDSFLNENLLKCIGTELKKENVYAALTIWKRHQGEFKSHLNPAIIKEIMVLIPSEIQGSDIQTWLEEDLIPMVMCNWPDVLPTIAEFIEQKTRRMENMENWPQSGITFAGCYNCGCAIAAENGAIWEPVDLNTQSVLSRRALAIIECIENTEYKCLAILEVMKLAAMPWDPDIDRLITLGLSLAHPKVEDIRRQCQFAELKLLLRKYEVSEEIYSDSAAERLLYFLLKHDRPTSVSDAMEVVKVYSNLTPNMVYMFRLRFLIRQNRISECMELLKSMSFDDAVMCSTRIGIYTSQLLREPFQFSIQEEKQEYTNFTAASVSMLSYILLSLEKNIPRYDELNDLLQNFKFLLSLQVEFDEFPSIEEYQSPSKREALLHKHVSLFFMNKPGAKEFSATGERKVRRNQQKTICKIYRLADILQISRDWFRGKLAIEAAKTGNIKKAVELCRDLQANTLTEDTAEALYRVVHILCEFLSNVDAEIPTNTVENLPDLMYDMAKQAVTYCSTDLIADCLQLCKTCNMLLRLSKQCHSGDFNPVMQETKCTEEGFSVNPYSSWMYDNFFSEDGLMLESAIALPNMCKYTLACLPQTGGRKHAFLQNRIQGQKMVELVEEVVSEENIVIPAEPKVVQMQQIITSIVPYLRQRGHNQIALEIMMDAIGAALCYMVIQDMSGQEGLKKIMQSFGSLAALGRSVINEILKGLLPKILKHHFVDGDLALGFLFCLPKDVVHTKLLDKIINTCGYNYKRVEWISQVGLNYTVLCNEITAMATIESLLKEASWGSRLSKIKVDYREAFRKSKEHKQKLLPVLAKNQNMTVSLLTEFCRDFCLSSQMAFYDYLEYLLKPHLNGAGDGQGHVDPAQIKRTASQVIAILHQREPKKIKEKLREILSELDPYDYDMIRYLLTEFFKIDNDPLLEKGMELLTLLDAYKRVAPPTQYEISYSSQVEENDQDIFQMRSLSPLSKERLPFHPLLWGKQWKIITPELQEDNVDQWIPTATLLSLSVDHVYMLTIKNITHKHIERLKLQGKVLEHDKAKCDWSTESINIKMFAKISSLLSSMNSCELAVVCASWVVKELPMGAEKVQAFGSCVKLTKSWSQIADGDEKKKAMASFVQFSQVYKKIYVEQILYSSNLDDPELLALCGNPRKLIIKLYEHDSIPERMVSGGIIKPYPDIHKAVKEIAVLHDIDVHSLNVELIDKWLAVSNNCSMTDATMTFNFNMNMDITNMEVLNEDEINLKRVMFILLGDDIKKGLSYLLLCSIKKDVRKRSDTLRGWRVLLALSDDATLDEMGFTKQKIKDRIKLVNYLVELEKLHINHSEESFQACDKESLVLSIWKNHSHEQRAVRVITNLCLEYSLYDVQLWSGLIKQMLTFSMTEFLELTLVQIASISELLLVTHLKQAWMIVIMTPFLSAVPPLSGEQLQRCLNSVTLLQRCPVLHDLDLRAIHQNFLKANLTPCTFYCLMLTTKQEIRHSQIKNFFESRGIMEFLKDVDELRNKGALPGVLEQVIHEVYEYIDMGELYEVIIDSSHQQTFVAYLLEKDSITNLLKFGILQNKIEQVTAIVQIYHKRYPYSESAEICNEDETVSPIKAYLAVHGMLDELKEYIPSSDEEEDIVDDEDTSAGER